MTDSMTDSMTDPTTTAPAQSGAAATIPRLGRRRLPMVGDVGGHAAGGGVFDLVPAFDELGSLISRETFGRRMFLAGRVDVAADLCDDTVFAKFVGPGLQLARRVVGDGLFTAFNDEPNWAKAHDILVPAFTLDEIDTYHPAMLAVADELCRRWDAAADDGSAVDVTGDLTALTFDTIGRAGFGYDFGSFRRAEPHPFVVSLQGSLAHNQRLLRRPPGTDFLHRSEDAAQERRAQHVQDVIDEVLQERRSSGDTSTDDLLGLMLNAVHPASGTPLDDANIRNQVLTFLVAGHETTSGALSFALQALVKNPAALARATAEVDALWGPADNPRPGPADVPKLRYVRQVLDETLRLWPTAPVFNRVAATDTLIGGRYRVPAGQPVSVVVPALHRDPVWGPNVEAFDPDRFTPDRAAARPPHAYKPFGTGERACIGNRFALHEATLVLGLLLHRYTLDDHANYRMKIVQALTIKPEGLTLRLRKRTPHDRAVPSTPTVAAVASAATTRRAPGTPLLVLHGSNLGSTRRWADTLAGRAEDAGFAVTRGALDEAADGLPTDRPVLVVAASYNGRPTDDAEKFVARLTDAGSGEYAGVRYGVLGVGDRNWSVTYQRVPTLIDDRLADCGAQRLVARGEADNSIGLAAGAEPWIEGALATLLDEFGEETAERAPAATGYRVRELDAPDIETALHRGTLALTVEENRPLTDEGRPGRTKRLVRLALPAGQRYRTGDQLVVRVANPDALVDHALAAFDLDGDRWVSVEHGGRDRTDGVPAGVPITVRRLLRETVELQDPASVGAVRRLAELNPCPPEAARLAALADEPARPRLVELVERNPALRGRLDLATLLDLLGTLRTRTYSISSSPATSPTAVDLLVAVLEYDTPEEEQRCGIGSGYLATLRRGEKVQATLQSCREVFRVDPHATEPTVLVAAGSGLAPFRGAVADRMRAHAEGADLAPLTLYFGCDDPDLDFLHRTELEDAAATGAITLRPAFSTRPVDGVQFAQHAMARDADQIWSALQAGGRVLVCGDARRLAPGVRDVLQQLHRDRTGSSEESAQDWLAELSRDGRYVEDVYSG